MNAMFKLFVCASASIVVAGCATVVTRKAELGEKPNGVRVYPPKIYLMVDEGEKESRIVSLPDYSRAYDIKPRTLWAKQEFKIELDEGQLKALTANQDTTAILSFIKDGATLAAKAAGAAVASTVIKGTFGLTSGIYQLNDDGVFVKVKAGTAQ